MLFKDVKIYFYFFLFFYLQSFGQKDWITRDSAFRLIKHIQSNASENFDKNYRTCSVLLQYAQQKNDTLLMIKTYLCWADIMWYQYAYSKAEELYFKSLQVSDSLKYPLEYAYALYGIGWIECVQKYRIDKIYLLKHAQKIFGHLKDTSYFIAATNSISGAYSSFAIKDINKKKLYLDSAILSLENLIQLYGLKYMLKHSQIMQNLAELYFSNKNIKKASEYMELIKPQSVSNSSKTYYYYYILKAKILYEQKNLSEAYYILTNIILPTVHYKNFTSDSYVDIYDLMYKLEKKRKNYLKAMEWLEKKSEKEMQIFYDLTLKHYEELKAEEELFKKEQSILNLKKQNELHEIQNRQKNIILFIAGFSIIIISIFLYRLNIQNKKIKTLHHQVTLQKNSLQQKNKDILDSINYASRIQKALITPDNFIQKHFMNEKIFSEYFVLYLPKDIVSGDFYWATINPTHEKKPHYLAVCDCTGHGVPGAFMSLLNINYLNEAVQEKQIYYPNEILNYVRNKLIQNLSYDEQQKDGMDASLVLFDKDFYVNKKIHLALANHQIVHISSDKNIQLISGDKMPVGKGHFENTFTLTSVHLHSNDWLYLYTDGYKDQFGGMKDKRITQKKFIDLLSNIHAMPAPDQKQYLYQFFMDWKKNNEQTDDVCIIGFKVV